MRDMHAVQKVIAVSDLSLVVIGVCTGGSVPPARRRRMEAHGLRLAWAWSMSGVGASLAVGTLQPEREALWESGATMMNLYCCAICCSTGHGFRV